GGECGIQRSLRGRLHDLDGPDPTAERGHGLHVLHDHREHRHGDRRQRGDDGRGHVRVPAGPGRGGRAGGGGTADRRVDDRTAAERWSGPPAGRNRRYAEQVDRCSLIAPCTATDDRTGPLASMSTHPLDMTKTVTELPASTIRRSSSAAPPLGAADEAVGSSPLKGTSAGNGFAGTTWVALLTSFDAPNTCVAESTAKPSGIASVTGFPPTEAASLALITVVTRVRP